jgi:uncharacterized membrane protein YgdD (TMEM256/DUF423 family)
MDRVFFSLGALSALISVAAGAFGAHGLKARLSSEMIMIFETGVRYQMYHALGLLAVAWAQAKWPSKAVIMSGWLFIVGTFFFSGSLYLMTLTGVRWLGAITPIGGTAFLAGWLLLAWGAWRRQS